MRIKSKAIVGIVVMSVLLMLVATASATVFSGLENEETIWTDAGTTTTKSSHLFLLVVMIFLIVAFAIGIIINYCLDNKEMVVGHVIAESCAVISLMFSIDRIAILSLLFAVSAFVVVTILVGLMLRYPQKYLS